MQVEEINFFNDIDEEQIKSFLYELQEDVISLYEKAHMTNDLKQSKHFADGLLQLAQKHQMEYFENYANDLLKKIDLFDIEAIEKLMDDYAQLINLLKKKVQ